MTQKFPFLVLLLGVFASCAVSASAQTTLTTDRDRLWVQDYKNLSVGVYLNDDKQHATLPDITRDDVRTKAELRLRRAGIPPVTRAPQELFILVNITGPAFAVQVHFVRTVSWALPNGHMVYDGLTTWVTDWVGIHGDDRAFLLSSIEDGVDRFINAYLKANQESNSHQAI